jgi:hypothetical protein
MFCTGGGSMRNSCKICCSLRGKHPCWARERETNIEHGKLVRLTSTKRKPQAAVAWPAVERACTVPVLSLQNPTQQTAPWGPHTNGQNALQRSSANNNKLMLMWLLLETVSGCSDWHHLAAMGPAEILSAVEDHETIYSSLDKPLGHKRFEGF